MSVKALVPFPAVLSMMSEKMEWTQMVGNAFLAQEEDVMATVQQLRKRAYDKGNLTNTGQQLVTRENDVISIVPRNPSVVYVPVYDPWWVYGPWWWPAHPPYVVYPYSAGVVLAPGFIWFGAGFFVGAFWGPAWGHCDWHHHHIYVNTHHRIHIKRPHIKPRNIKTKIWIHNPVHRRGVTYPNRHTRERFGKKDQNEVKNRRLHRGFNRVPGGDVNKAQARAVRSGSLTVRQTPRKTTTIRARSLPGKQVPHKVPTVKSRSTSVKQAPRKAATVRSRNLPDRQAARKAITIRSGSSPGKQVSRKAPAVKPRNFSGRQDTRKSPAVRSGSQHGRSDVRNERGRYNTSGRFDAARGVGFRRGR